MTNHLKQLIFLIIMLFVSSVSYANVINAQRRVSSADGLSSNIVHDIAQDSDGYMWFGTVNGLCRFDGYSFVNYSSLSPSAEKYIAASIAEIIADNSRGLIWVTTPRNQVACFDTNTSTFADYTDKQDYERQYRKLMLYDKGMWMYDTRQGARQVEYADGVFTCTDFNISNGMLPDNNVVGLVTDENGNAWIGTEKGIVLVDCNKQTKLLTDKKIVLANSDGKTMLFLTNTGAVMYYDNHGRLVRETPELPYANLLYRKTTSSLVWQGKWFIFTNQATFVMDIRTGRFSRPEWLQVPGGQVLKGDSEYQFLTNKEGALWIFPREGSVKHLQLLNEGYIESSVGRKIRVARGRDGLIYLATQGNGLHVYNPRTEAVSHYSSEDRLPLIASNSLLAVATDHTGAVWVAEESAGVSCLSSETDINVQYLQPAPDSRNYMADFIKNISVMPDGRFSVSTNDARLYTFDPVGGKLDAVGMLAASAYAHTIDSKGRAWIGTRGSGLYVDGQLYSPKDNIYRCPSEHIYDIKEDGNGNIWIATWGNGLLKVVENSGRLEFHAFLNNTFNERYVRQMAFDMQGNMWLATNDGLMVSRMQQNDSLAITKFNIDNGKFPASEIMCISIMSDGEIWVGTQSLGVIICSYRGDGHLDYRLLSTKQGLTNNNVRSIIEDNRKQVWVCTEDGLSRIDRKSMRVKNYRPSHELMGNVFSEDCAAMTDDGRLLLGTTRGLAVIELADDQADDGILLRPSITDIRVNGISIFSSSETVKQAHNLLHGKQITLEHNHNSLSFHFSNFAYSDILSSLYQFWLEGSDADWQPVSNVNHADYSKLPPGRYTFHLKSLAGNSNWSDPVSLVIVIDQPWYNTWWAWLIYILLANCVAYLVCRTWRRNFELHQQMVLDKQLNEFRINFFTHIAHEFRTPLALIQGAVDKIGEAPQTAVPKTSMQTIRRGTSRLLRLVNQLMEFRKISTGNLRLAVEPTDVIDFVRSIYQDFWQQAKLKNITVTLQPFASSFIMPADRHKLETMVYNLLSNAVKYTPEDGSIIIVLSEHAGKLFIKISNSGPGISAEQQKRLFQPFMHGYVSQGGMGIGLYNARNMAECHHGTLSYQCGANGDGSVFTIMLPTGESAYSPDEYKTEINSLVNTKADELPEELIHELLPEALNNHTVAIIEDDPDMMQQIRGEVGQYFNVTCYTYGEAACQGVFEQPPSLILCDVMLPDIDGYEIVRRIRKDEGTFNTPVIMLTALDDDAHQLRAYRAGADDYITKPCNFKLLMARISKLIEWSERLKTVAVEADGQELATEKIEVAKGKIVLDRQDKLFRDRVVAVIARHVSDPTFNIDMLAAEMCMGRTKFYGKVKELMDMSPNKLLMNERMRIAAELIKEGRLTISEVAYKTGFESLSYFNKCFKKHFGVAPSQYKA